MKQQLNSIAEGLSGGSRHGRGAMALPATIALLIGVGAFACADETSPSLPSAPVDPASDVTQGMPADETETNGASDGTPGAGDAPAAGDAPSTEGGEQPEVLAPSADVDDGQTAVAGGGADAGVAIGVEEPAEVEEPEDEWVPLFNGVDLDGWVVHGTNQPLFEVENGEIHVYPTQADQSDQPQANLRSTTSLGGKYTLHVEYKWGEARFGGRRQTERDAGILFHVTGDVTRVWPDSIECQIGSSPINGNVAGRTGSDWVTGDLWVLGNPTTAQTPNANGQLQTHGGGFGFSSASEQAENPLGEWNTVDVIIDGATEAIYVVNGVEVNRVFNMVYNGQPLSEGFVSVQAEFAELFYRDIRYRLDE
jgi:hypothetical protein